MFCSKVNYQSSGQPRSVTAARDLGHQPPNKTGIYFQDTLCLSRILQKRPCKSAKIMFYHSDEWTKKLWYIYAMEYYSAIKGNAFESVLMS